LAGSLTASEVRVRFTVETSSGVFVDEPDATDLTLPVGSYRRVRGQVRIRSGKLPVVQPEDELVPLVTNLCFRAVVELRDREHVSVNYTDMYGILRLDREAATTRISGDRVPDIRVETTSLVTGLVDCGARFRAWLPSCRLDGDVDGIVDRLRAEEDLARAALTTRW
jgi:hypothetical protein